MSRFRKMLGTTFVAVGGALGLLVPSVASAQFVPEPHPGPVQPEVLEKFAACPGPDALPEGFSGAVCISVDATGELKLGNVRANIDDPIVLDVAVALGPGFSTAIVPAEGGGAPEPVKISGGVLGIPELDPILDEVPLGLLSVSASPTLGDVIVGDPEGDPLEEGINFLLFLAGETEDLDGNPLVARLGLPLSIKLNNLLFGNKCHIGTPDDPFTINLTTGTTSPPAPFAPLTGALGEPSGFQYPGGLYVNRADNQFVDNTFRVPGASKCNLVVGDLLNGPTGLFDGLINNQTGLPAAPGRNEAKFSITTDTITYPLVYPSTP